MPIPALHSHRFIYHFTHLDNLPGMLQHGFHCPNEHRRLGLTHKSIALQGIQNRRATMEVTCGPGGVVHDYVPFYLCKRSSMLMSVLYAKNVDQQFLIYLAFPISLIERDGVVFTDASANTDIPPNFYSGAQHLDRINWTAVDSMKWRMPTDAEKQARMAEVLVHRSVDMALIDHIVVWNEGVRDAVRELYNERGLNCPPIRFDSRHYFTKWPEADDQSLVTGPFFTKRHYEEAVASIRQQGHSPTARFESLASLRQALRLNFACLPETAELVGLESENEMHTEDVGTHTLSVVRELLESPEFQALNPTDRLLTEIAAYLHDIGKGPRSRWASKGGKQQVDPDHPLSSLAMLCRILTQEVRAMQPRSAQVLAKLVCYHELVGDILGKGRRPEQLEEIAGTERELDMLIALGLADMRAVNPAWNVQHAHKLPALRARVLAKLPPPPPQNEE